jgi:hypothetical protein
MRKVLKFILCSYEPARAGSISIWAGWHLSHVKYEGFIRLTGAWQMDQIWGCHTIMTNFFEENDQLFVVSTKH